MPDREASDPLRVVIADDHPLFRAGIVRAIREDGRFEVVGEAPDAATAERLIRDHTPQVATVDLRMPGDDGIQLVARLRHFRPPVAIVVLSAFADPSVVHNAMAAGATAYVAKDAERDEILDVLVDAAQGRRRVLVAPREDDDPVPRPRLAARERTVLSALNRGWSREEVVMLTGIPARSVEAHLANARRKLGAATDADAIAAAAAWGLLS